MRGSNDGRPIALLTGGTGGLGSEMLPRLARAYPEHCIVAIVRGKDTQSARARLLAPAEKMMTVSEQERVEVICGDLEKPCFGLDRGSMGNLLTETTDIYNLAANVDFDAPLDVSRRANVEGTKTVLAFARLCNSSEVRLHHVSTAYVAGDRKGLLLESELGCGQKFWNSYEQSKFESEQLIRASLGEIPSTVYRPSQIIGESKEGRIAKFFGFYEFLKLIERKKTRMLIADAKARPDMVPVDYVCDGILCLGKRKDSIGQTYHLAAGLTKSASVTEVVDAVHTEHSAISSVSIAKPRILDAGELMKAGNASLSRRYHSSALKLLMKTYMPYLAYERDFDVEQTQALLESEGLSFPDAHSSVVRATRYALATRYGTQDYQLNPAMELNNG